MDTRPVFFFDVDDCLYPRSLGVSTIMSDLLEKFVMKNLSLSAKEAGELNWKYFQEHGLTVIGLVKLHGIDPMHFNREVDDALPLDRLLTIDEGLRVTLRKFDPSKIKLWLLTNAHVTHGLRVVKLLGVENLFEGITYCDYSNGVSPLKPHQEMFAKAEKDAGVTGPDQCFFVDDSVRNCEAARKRGWQVVRILEADQPLSPNTLHHEIRNLDDIHHLFPQFSV